MLRNDLYIPWFVDDKWGFEIITGEFIGVVIEVEKFNIKEDDSGEVQLDYHIIKQPESMQLETDNPLLMETIGVIFNDILKEAVENYEHSRNVDSQEPSSQ